MASQTFPLERMVRGVLLAFFQYNEFQKDKKEVAHMRAYKWIASPIGKYILAENGEGITFLEHAERELDERLKKEMASMEEKDTPLLLEADRQLQEYFRGKRQTFDLPLAAQGTPFQMKVWEALRQVPYGETRSYKEIAAAVDNPKGMRAIGMANNRNPIAIITPCHRVIGTNGKLVGYAGGLALKGYLLDLEAKAVKEKE
ncbi:ogt: methylated-dna--[protein]-cysteine s-methyltransferase [Trichococcus palustris]|uniref:Methylated-DNA--protein-cysteine methyltransferase n=1 Tax=Trichococcus palustris TaxID=140314 RepID=A0A143YF54_9LACT|nr:methylated-DNA--[protein]-cysteine S-methyltransferase [Trichococcus palustris]CZQ88453.1 ogt: methylated-dna--[protein]-cysteine s-methyltransferase [Trichococcus palustris]SFL12501.1 methylated-DNA-[protein]-cysteine S-methyltransferase [Trichococcus palustris]